MSPIKGVSELRRMPRLGKIRLGIKQISPRTQNPYPVATDYFVVADEIKKYVGEKPKTLEIMFPVEDPREFAIQWLRCYSFTQGLVCKGDGLMSRRKVDVESGVLADHTTTEWEWKDGLPCNPETCLEYSSEKPQCRRVMNLLFLMPDVPGFGVWQLDTSSFYSIVNINSCIDLIRRLCGRISFIPLTLSLEPQIVEPPGIKKKTVHILQIRSDVKLAEIQRLGRKRPEQVLLPELEEEEIPTDLYPEEVLAEAEGFEPTKIEVPAAEVEGEGFHIEIAWLDRTLKEIKWSHETAKSWIASNFKDVDTQGELSEVLSRLTREQAEQFVHHIQELAAKKQMQLFE